MCAGCQSILRAELCDDCERIVGSFPMRRESFDLMEALSYSWERYTAQWLLPTVSAVAFFVLTYVLAFLRGLGQLAAMEVDPNLSIAVSFGVQVVSNVMNAALMAVMMRMAVAALQGQTLSAEHVTQGLRRAPVFIALQLFYFAVFAGLAAPFGAAFGLGLFQGVDESLLFGGIAVGALLLFPLLIYVMLGLGSAGIESVIDPDVGIVEAFKRSWAVADGQRFTMLLGGFISFLLSLLGVIACCVGILPMWVLTMFLWAATYLGLRTGLLPSPARSFDR